MEGECTAYANFMNYSDRHAGEPTKQEKLLKKLEAQAMSNETKKGGGKLTRF